jgi:hypothetical protein
MITAKMPPVFAADAWVVLTALAAVAAVVVAIGLFVVQSRKQQKSLGYQKSERALVHVGAEARGKVRIQYEGEEVSDVHLVEIILRNTGNVPIARDDFDRPVIFSFPETTKLLPATLTAVGYPEEIRPAASLSNGAITVEPMLLNPGDRITVGILASGLSTSEEIGIDVRVLGIREVVETIERPQSAYAKAGLGVVGAVAGVGGAALGQWLLRGKLFR